VKRFKNILFFAAGCDGPSPTLERAMGLAVRNDARLTVADVIEPTGVMSDLAQHVPVSVDDLLVDRRLEQLEDMVASKTSPSLSVETAVFSGTDFIEIIRAVQHQGFDLVIKPAQGSLGLSERLFGSTDMHLLRKCPCPVWIDRATDRPTYKRILAAVDPKDGEDVVGRLVMDLATSMALMEQADLAVVHAWHLPGESVVREGRYRLPELEMRQLLDGAEGRQRDALAALLSHYQMSVEDPAVHLVKGKAAPAIHDTAQDLGVDLIVMGSVGRTGIPGFFIGNTAEDVLQSAHASVLAVKPEGFRSPVS
jgi:universal stress protein E